MPLHPYLIPLKKIWLENSHPENAKGMSKYLLNQFQFFGIKTPLRRVLTKAYIHQHPIHELSVATSIVRSCFEQKEREFQYFGIEFFSACYPIWEPESIHLFNDCIQIKSWWDSVDAIASYWTGPFFKKYPELIKPISSKWNQSENIWLQRSSIMFQKAYKEKTDTHLLGKYILHCTDSKEFFIQKAIGWALREYSKTDPNWVIQFVQKNKMASLSKREAIKRIQSI